MKLIKLGAGVLNQTPLDWNQNSANIRQAILTARQQQVDILCLPELCITGYGCEDAFHAPGVHAMALSVLEELVSETSGLIVSVGLPVAYRGSLFNAACLVANGQILGFVGKQNLAGEGLHYEPRWFKAWPEGTCVDLQCLGRSYPFGDIVFDCGGIGIGFEICEDAWVAGRPGGRLARVGVDVILNPSASHFAFDKHQVRQRFVMDGSRAFHVAYVYANLVGNEAGRAIYDGDAMIASCGQLLASGTRFSYQQSQLTTAQVDLNAIRVDRARTGSFRPAVASADIRCVRAEFTWHSHPLAETEATPAAWEFSQHRKEEEFTRAVSLGLFDYLRKSRSRGFVVSLSGGADSAAVATLCGLLVHLAMDELGPAEFGRRLAHVDQLRTIPADADRCEIVRCLLACVYQSTRNSSTTTRDAAAGVAAALGAEFLEFDVDPLVQQYVQMVANGIGRSLSWQTDDLALQNIQARARGPGVWLLANLRGALLLATSNRSEAAVGYATMDGDTCGGLSPIAGIDKAFLRRWLRWMEADGPHGVFAIPDLAAVNGQAPTAELRPRQAAQTDEADLMPYEILDAIERAAIRDKQSPLEICQRLALRCPSYPLPTLGMWVDRFFRLWCRNQWKRERYAPSFHLDDENLDPKTWCRFPILSGGFERELRELAEFVTQETGKDQREPRDD